MVRSTLAVAVILLFASAALAQHSSSGGSSSGGGGGGGSHGSSGGGSSSSGGSHSSGASHSSGGSTSHASSSSHGSSGSPTSGGHTSSSSSKPVLNSGSASSHSGLREPQSNLRLAVPERNGTKAEVAPKRGLWAFLRHPIPIPKPRPKPVPQPTPEPTADLRHRICLKGPCVVCPPGMFHSGVGCVSGFTPTRINNFCSRWGLWNSNACLEQNNFVDNCSGLRMAMERQARRMQEAELAEQDACSAGPSQACFDLTGAMQSEASYYRELQNRYMMCLRTPPSAHPFSSHGFGFGAHPTSLRFDPMGVNLD